MANPSIDPCWNRIGVSGNGSCPELATHVHCRNCPVFCSAGRELLDCQAPEEYVSEWTNFLAQEKEDLSAGKESAVIFRLGPEWLALPVQLFKEVTPVRVIHRLPHRSNSILLGIVNIRGEIRLCVSLKGVLGIDDEPEEPDGGSRIYKRMAVVEKERDHWVIPIDEIHGIHRYNHAELRKVPVTIAKAAVKFTSGMLPWQGKSVGFLDDELLFYSLRRSALSQG